MKGSSGRSAPTAGSSTRASAGVRSGRNPSHHAAAATLATRARAPKAASAPPFRPVCVLSSAIPTARRRGEQPLCHQAPPPPPRATPRGRHNPPPPPRPPAGRPAPGKPEGRGARGPYSPGSPGPLPAGRLRPSRLAIPRPPLPLRRKFVHALVEPLEQSLHPAPGRPTLEPLEEQALQAPLGLLITVPSDEMAHVLRGGTESALSRPMIDVGAEVVRHVDVQ